MRSPNALVNYFIAPEIIREINALGGAVLAEVSLASTPLTPGGSAKPELLPQAGGIQWNPDVNEDNPGGNLPQRTPGDGSHYGGGGRDRNNSGNGQENGDQDNDQTNED